MAEWWTYSLSDFLMFSPQAYWRLVERYHAWMGPAALLGTLAGVALVALLRLREPLARRAALALLAAAWLWCGVAFHALHYAEIFLGAPALAVACGAQGMMLLVACGFVGAAESDKSPAVGWLLVAAGAVAYPLEALVAGRPFSQAETFGLLPDPTALATLGALLLLPLARWQRAALCVLPVLSLAVGWSTRSLLAQ